MTMEMEMMEKAHIRRDDCTIDATKASYRRLDTHEGHKMTVHQLTCL